jgi:sulfatase-modifying factor enzyme 1
VTWQQPSEFEQRVLADVGERWPEILPLARALALATRIEPLLMRAARLKLAEGCDTETESLFWFSPLIGARGSRQVSLHPGVARLLADALRKDDPKRFADVWTLTRNHTVHWSAEDRLEQDLRYFALTGAAEKASQARQDMLRLIRHAQDEKTQVNLARWVRRLLPLTPPDEAGEEKTQWLAQYAGEVLGGAVFGADIEDPAPLPAWLAQNVPPPYKPARLRVEFRYDALQPRPVLHCVEPKGTEPAIEFPTALPAELHVKCEGAPGGRHRVSVGTRIALPLLCDRVTLSTIDGRQYELRAEVPLDSAAPSSASARRVFLTYVERDANLASRVADWLKSQEIEVELLEELKVEPAGESESDHADASVRLIRLWTPAARQFWSQRTPEELASAARALLLRTPDVDAPPPGLGAEQSFDLPDLDRADRTTEAASLAAHLKSWLEDIESGAQAAEAPLHVGQPDELETLLAELDDPDTPPPRRLEIGDRLAVLGDPRPGVGVREFELPSQAEFTPQPVTRVDPQVQRLLDELERSETEPPRRLEIGDLLAERGDPRLGVGLDDHGLPDVGWVEIPAGDFVYQGSERIALSRFFMARYPITNIQYQCFIDAGGYADERWWQDLDKPEPEAPRWPQSNRPRTDVSWYEATAYCRWLSAQLGYEIRLPSEQEWERAAAGREGHAYPWGGDYRSGCANVNERAGKAGSWHLEQTTAVGVYPQGGSVEGVLDLSGNVWEWCANEHDRPDETATDRSGDDRVLRGGSWVNSPGGARASYRDGIRSDYRGGRIGFRVVSSAPID